MGFLDLISNDIGIDLGTANTLVFVRGQGIVLNEPSVVAIEVASKKVLAVGAEAKEMIGRTPGEIMSIRPLKDGVIADFEITEKLLSNFIRRVVKHRYLMKPRIVISVPSGITEVEKRAVRDSAENAGAREVFLIQEPMAAAIGVGLPVHLPSGTMVIDVGGGTSEIAVIALNGIVNNISIRIGGDEMDEAITLYLKKNYNLLIGERTAEEIKIKIGSAFPLDEEESMEIKGRDLVAGIPKTMKISSVQVREALSEPVDAIIEAVRQALEETPPELAADILDKGIIVTGGGALLKGMDRRLREETNLAINVAEDPLTCVVKGTGKVLEDMSHFSKVLIKSKRD
ncbi:MAG: rod shape-determining protein MreB [candidate division Zixibacteria bacterium SM23_73]|uniref:Cell shape-determining protein MreB n=1 Tax=candidate division WOR-1 bacterium DG_54_3 TaxID=1703775 RepID=A0A0S7XRR3_UNCSA|nr:MAG: rod shape-determining protein MreB [candidate division WOR-1 bacterium DG_54_3]KPK78642.1 MAG: rod shape-determining protein MreB [candidate division Zixibacteria bacterium SM23_73]